MTDLRFRIADEISGIQVGSGYESTTIGITAALEAADALIAAGVVAEEPEWEWGYRLVGDDGNVYKTGFAYDDPAEPSERAKMRAAEENEVREETGEPRLAPELIRRLKAGPWEPVN